MKKIARNKEIKAYIQENKQIYSMLRKGAHRYITGEKRFEGIKIAQKLFTEGYRVSLEYIGENSLTIKDSVKAKEEFLHIINDFSTHTIKQTVSLDLSHIGLTINPKIAEENIIEIAEKASMHNITIMISMEESDKTEDILSIYKNVSKMFSNVGITIQAHLYRSREDIKELLTYPGKIRVVKGAYKEPTDIAIPRSNALNENYLYIVEQLIRANHPVSIATYDEAILDEFERRNYFQLPNVEIEMLYGIQPHLLKKLQNKGYPCKVYLTYGNDWFLYVCHRLAEHPKNIYQFISDIVDNK
ncbi:proline dehydrogenase family protein [Pseudogracilibacillus sp. SE30717A]